MGPIATHYERLGVRPDASADEIRVAYRRLARVHHPDARGGRPSPEMADLNEAWRVLSDPARRAVYDASLRPVRAAPRPTETDRLAEERYPVAPRPDDDGPPHFPLGWILLLAVLGGIFVITAGALHKAPAPAKPDGLLDQGSCVVFDPNGDAAEVACNQPNDGVVVEFTTVANTSCGLGAELHRDKQGRGYVCVKLSG